MRTMELTRDIAEMLVDLIEQRDLINAPGDMRLDILAQEIRQEFGMVTKEQEAENRKRRLESQPVDNRV